MAKNIRTAPDDIVFNVIVYAFIVFILFITVYPLYFVLIASFSDPLKVTGGQVFLTIKGFTTEAYRRVFNDSNIWNGFINTIIYTTVGTTVNLTLTTIGAYSLSRKTLIGRNYIMGFILVTMFFSGGLIPTYLVIRQLKMINTIFAMVLPGAISVFNMIVMRTFFQSIPDEIVESTELEGSTPIKTLIWIILPLSLPVISVIILFYAVAHWNSFFDGLIYLTSSRKYPLQLVLRNILIRNTFDDFMIAGDDSHVKMIMLAESIKYALILITSIPVLLLYPFLQKYFVKGVMVGAIKG